jgi:hypothetical protein
MKKVGQFSDLDLSLLYQSVQLATYSWKLWIRQDAIPDGHDIESGLEMVASLATLEAKLEDLLGIFDGLTEEDIDEIEEIIKEEEGISPDNVLQFPKENKE